MNRFRNANLSEPVNAAGVRFATLYSPALARRADMTLYVPDAGAVELPLLILLHGVYGSHWNWWAFGQAPESAAAMIRSGEILPLTIAMPSDGLWDHGSGYVAHRDFDAEAWIVEDVPQFVGEMLPQVRTDRCYLAGLSMGGYGALRLGMKHAAKVKGISAHSAVTRIQELEAFVQEPMVEYLAAGEANADILHWARRHRAILPPLRFDCGRQDSLLEGNRALHQVLEDEGIPHIYEEHSGGHCWEYWAEHVRDTLRFVSEIEERAGRISSNA
ncbi:MAG TPA: alpha/beta hydrolase-fold protein [Acidobacteriaceae bacterium]|nr:alpha/beta hydrolase-fold protein [Acidobacteriaceae bacterium]